VKGETVAAGLEDGSAENVGRHEVGRGLHALKAEPQQAADRFDDERLGGSRHAFEQRVALGQHGHQHLADHCILAGDDAAQFCARL